MTRRIAPLSERIERLSIPEPNSGCWLWLGHTDEKGYGRIGVDGKNWRAHRAAWLAYRGEFGGLHVLHRCDNPPCCNPEHLFLGTQSDNMRDMQNKGRHPNRGLNRGESHHMTNITEDVVRAILATPKYTKGLTKRFGISASGISFIRQRKTWKHVQEVDL
jgi:hypothetical protein